MFVRGGNLKSLHLWRVIMRKCGHMAWPVHAGLGAGMAAGSSSGADKNIHKKPCRPNLFMMEKEREGEREGESG